MTADLIFEEPPERQSTRGKVAALLAPLRDRPGEWARLPGKQSVGYAYRINRGGFAGVEPGEFEAVTRNQANSRADIYVRYVGEASQ